MREIALFIVEATKAGALSMGPNAYDPHCWVVVVIYSYFLYRNKQTSAKTQWAFEVITPSPQGGIYISKIKSNNSSEV